MKYCVHFILLWFILKLNHFFSTNMTMQFLDILTIPFFVANLKATLILLSKQQHTQTYSETTFVEIMKSIFSMFSA